MLGLKDNQPTMRREVEEYFESAQREPQNYSDVKTTKTMDYGHGRIETRTYYLTTEVDWFESRKDRCNLRSFGMVCSKVEEGEKTTEDRAISLHPLKTYRPLPRQRVGIGE